MPRTRRTVDIAGLGVIAISLATLSMCSSPSSGDLSQSLAQLVSGLVENEKSVRNCVLAVTTSDGAISWSGAAGVAKQDGQIPMTRDTPIYIASVTKLYTATAILRLYEDGKLSLNDPISKFLPQALIHGIQVYEGKDYSNDVTIEQLLSHTSGIADYYDDKPEGGKSLFETFLEDPGRSWTVEETIARARNDLKSKFAPGTRVSYSDTNYQLLGKIIESVSRKPLHVVFDEIFFRPLGLRHSWLTRHAETRVTPSTGPAEVYYKDANITRMRSNGAFWADGGIVSTAGEMIAFLKALNEGKLIRRDTLQRMHNWRSWQFPLQYGYGTMYFKLPPLAAWAVGVPPLWGHSGSTGSFLYYSEDLGLYLAGTVDQVDSKIRPFRFMMRVIKAIQSHPRMKARGQVAFLVHRGPPSPEGRLGSVQ